MNSYKPEQIAIRQHLSKPAQNFWECGCLGIQTTDGSKRQYMWTVFMTSYGENKLEVIRVLHSIRGDWSLKSTKDLVESVPAIIHPEVLPYRHAEIREMLEKAGATVEAIPKETNLEPFCPCAMAMVEQVDGNYYQIIEKRSPDGVTFDANLLGPVGGPYNIKES